MTKTEPHLRSLFSSKFYVEKNSLHTLFYPLISPLPLISEPVYLIAYYEIGLRKAKMECDPSSVSVYILLTSKCSLQDEFTAAKTEL